MEGTQPSHIHTMLSQLLGVLSRAKLIYATVVQKVIRQTQRPRVVLLRECERVLITGLILLDSPFWTVHILYSRDVLVLQVGISAPRNSPNTDAIAIDSS